MIWEEMKSGSYVVGGLNEPPVVDALVVVLVLVCVVESEW